MSTEKTMTEAAYARYRGVARQTVSRWKSRGLVVMIGAAVNVAASDAELDKRPETYRGGTASRRVTETPAADLVATPRLESRDWSLAEALRHKEIAAARRRELDFEVASGKLINADDAESIVRSDYAMTATRLLGIPSKVAPRLAAMKTAAEVEAFLHHEISKALNALSKAADDQLRKLDS